MKSNKLSTKKIVFLSIFVVRCLLAREGVDEITQFKIGNLAVPGTMQPGPFLGFGENIIEPHDALGLVYPSWLFGKNEKFVDLLPYVLYGIRDDLSVLLAFPTALSYNEEGYHSSGSSDLLVQFEYAFHVGVTPTISNELTLVASVFLPTGNECKRPPTGLGVPHFFVGVTATHLSIEWYCYTSYGVLFTTKYDHNNKAGNQFVYEAGFGKNIAYSSNKWMLMWMVEVAGLYKQRSKFNGIIDENSGFNEVLVGPSLWFSTERFILQGGVAAVASQHLFGEQAKSSAFVSFGCGLRFN